MASSSTGSPLAAQGCKVLSDLDLSLAQLQKCLRKTAKEFIVQQGQVQYDPNQTVGNNFLRLCQKQEWQIDGQIFRQKLHLLVCNSLKRIQPPPVDRHCIPDYAGRFFARRFPGSPTDPASTYRIELRRLAIQQQPRMSEKEYAQALADLEQTLAARIAVAIVKHTKEIPCLKPLASGTVSMAAKTNKPTEKSKPADKKEASRTNKAAPKNKPADKKEPAKKGKSANNSANHSVKQQPKAESPSTRFTDRFPEFTRDPTEDLTAQFDLLAIQQNWSKNSKTYRKRRSEFFADIFEEEWSEIVYTPDETDDEGDEPDNLGVDITKAWKLSQWQDLCNELGVDPLPKTITQCKKALEEIHVNIFDLLEARFYNNAAERMARGDEGGVGLSSGDLGGDKGFQRVTVRRFESASALAKYTLATGKVFSKTNAKRQGALRALLRHVFGRSGGRVV